GLRGGVVPMALGVYGAVRLEWNRTRFGEGVRLGVMQPNLQQDEKFNYSQKQEVMRRYLALSEGPAGPQSIGLRNVTILIWPESAFPFFLVREPEALAQLDKLLSPGTLLITCPTRPPPIPPAPPVPPLYP